MTFKEQVKSEVESQ